MPDYKAIVASRKPLTPVMLETVKYIAAYQFTHGRPPTRKMIAEHFHIADDTAYERVKGLVNRGAVKVADDKLRTMLLTPKVFPIIQQAAQGLQCPTCGKVV